MKGVFFKLCILSCILCIESFTNLANILPTRICKHLKLNAANPERVIYASYLIGYRKQKKLLTNITKVTSNLIQFNKNDTNTVVINNTDKKASQINMGNIILDVTDVKYIYITTDKDEIKIKLDKKEKQGNPLQPSTIFESIHNIEALYTTINLLEKIIHLS